MVSRQAGHFFFEPKGYDEVNHATHEHKEDIKVGYNLRRKIVLLAIWALSPALLWLSPTLFGIFPPYADRATFIQHVGQIWLVVGFGALLFRTVQLFFIRDVQTGLVWMTKILTDPFHDFMLYYRAPFYLLGGPADRSDGRCTRARSISSSTRRLMALLVSASFAPPPAILLHLPRRRYEPIGDRGKVCIGVIQAEDEPARSHPAQRQVFGAQIILKHPVVARWLQIADRPYRGEIGHPDLRRPASRRRSLSRAARPSHTASSSR